VPDYSINEFILLLYEGEFFVRVFTHVTTYLCLAFFAIFPFVDAQAACKKIDGVSLGLGRCASKISRLESLFMSKKNVEIEVPKEIVNERTPIPYPTKSPIQKKIKVKNIPTALPTHNAVNIKNHIEVVSYSTNKNLSKYGPDAPAEFIVRCKNQKLNVLINFPGYPMNFETETNILKVKVDTDKAWTTLLKPTHEFSVMGIREEGDTQSFLSSIMDGNHLRLMTEDIEATQINAEFDITDITSKVRKLDGICHLPS
jgi:hypothetical protein